MTASCTSKRGVRGTGESGRPDVPTVPAQLVNAFVPIERHGGSGDAVGGAQSSPSGGKAAPAVAEVDAAAAEAAR